ncbi:MAG: FtsH protease activity modulator HflK [Verrucomicrobiota bacterium]|jgi:membrane protease subunit HflK
MRWFRGTKRPPFIDVTEGAGPGAGKNWVRYLPGLIVGWWLLSAAWTSIYAVPADSEAVVTRFGKFSHVVTPGLRFKLPWGIDEVTKVPVKRQLKVEFGFSTPGSSSPFQSTDASEQEREKRMVTGDLNVAVVEWVVQYRVNDPRAFTFKVRDPEVTLRDLSESVMRQVVGDRTVDEVITVGRQEIEFEALKEMQRLANLFETGITVDQVQLKDVNPPGEVQASFNEVNQAQQERERAINQAKGQFNKIIPQARGMADQKLSEAEGYATRRVKEAEGDVARFNSLLAEYVKAPEVTRRRLYLETMQDVLPRLGRRYVVDAGLRGVIPMLSMEPGDHPAAQAVAPRAAAGSMPVPSVQRPTGSPRP